MPTITVSGLDEAGFGSALAALFAGVEAPEFPARDEFPEALQLDSSR